MALFALAGRREAAPDQPYRFAPTLPIGRRLQQGGGQGLSVYNRNEKLGHGASVSFSDAALFDQVAKPCAEGFDQTGLHHRLVRVGQAIRVERRVSRQLNEERRHGFEVPIQTFGDIGEIGFRFIGAARRVAEQVFKIWRRRRHGGEEEIVLGAEALIEDGL